MGASQCSSVFGSSLGSLWHSHIENAFISALPFTSFFPSFFSPSFPPSLLPFHSVNVFFWVSLPGESMLLDLGRWKCVGGSAIHPSSFLPIVIPMEPCPGNKEKGASGVGWKWHQTDSQETRIILLTLLWTNGMIWGMPTNLSESSTCI